MPVRLPSLSNLPQLSGNGLTGTLDDSLTIGSTNLQRLVLSHNVLKGAVSPDIQQHSWKNLDLSFNKLSGTIDNFVAQDPSASINLQNNRLSGMSHVKEECNIQNNQIQNFMLIYM